MSNARDAITVDPRGYSVVVDIFDATAAEAAVYTAARGSTAATLPDTITTPTTYYVEAGGYDVSLKVNGVELGTAAGGRVHVEPRSLAPVVVTPVLQRSAEREATDAGGGSATGGIEYVREFLFAEQATADNESYPLLSTSLADQTLTIAGDHTARFYAGFFFYVTGSGILNAADPNVVAASSFDGTNTVITVADGIVADSTDDGAVVFGSYRAALAIPARATVRDIHLLPIAGTWAASAQSLNISDTSAGPGSYVAASSIPFQTGDYDPQAVVLGGNFFTLREIGGVYKQAAEGPTKASSSSANNVLINTGSGVRYVADDTLTIEVITGIDPASLPITPTGQLLVRVFLTTTQTPTAATF